MKIEKVILYHLQMPLIHPFQTSFGLETQRECILVEVKSNGLTGWGECVALDRPSYSSETTGTAWHILVDFLIPQALTINWNEIHEFLSPFNWVRGNRMARAGLQSAIWDIYAQSKGQSLAVALTQPYSEGPRSRIPVGVSIGIQQTIDETIQRIAMFQEQGFSRIKLKIKPGWDQELLTKVREVFPEIDLMVDANSSYQVEDFDLLKEFDSYGLTMLEQPLAHDDIFWHSKLQNLIRTPLCLDESIQTPEQAAVAIEINACQMINIKPGRVGGLWETRRIHDICHENGMPVWCGGMLETGIGRAANLAAASLPNFLYPTDNGPTARYWEEDIIEEEFLLNAEDSTITLSDKPGLGVTPRYDRIDKYLLRKEVFR